MSNRRITHCSQVVQQLKFITLDGTTSELSLLLQQSFQFRLLRWLHGHGHPDALRGVHIPENVFDAEKDDPLVRAKLLLRAISETDLLPVGLHANITVCSMHCG
jgi:hypothetical protein